MKEYDILDCFKKSSIYPSNTNTYTIKELKKALYKCYPYSLNINCDYNRKKLFI